MSDAIEQLAKQYRLPCCTECGKCVAACPMWGIFGGLTYEAAPRRVVRQTLLGLDMLEHIGVWLCLTCDVCTRLCPTGVRFRDFVEATRRQAIQAGITKHSSFCRDCGARLGSQHAVEHLTQKLGQTTEGFLTRCPRCRQYQLGKKVKELARGTRL